MHATKFILLICVQGWTWRSPESRRNKKCLKPMRRFDAQHSLLWPNASRLVPNEANLLLLLIDRLQGCHVPSHRWVVCSVCASPNCCCTIDSLTFVLFVPQRDWLFYLSFQTLRNTVICQGIAARAKQGVASSKKAAQYVAVIHKMNGDLLIVTKLFFLEQIRCSAPVCGIDDARVH